MPTPWQTGYHSGDRVYGVGRERSRAGDWPKNVSACNPGGALAPATHSRGRHEAKMGKTLNDTKLHTRDRPGNSRGQIDSNSPEYFLAITALHSILNASQHQILEGAV
jgi:hypothetical protein